jgi:outer membrane immunogenic protein
MKKFLVAGFAAAVFCGAPAFATDMPMRSPAYKAAPAEVPYDPWNGLYLGLSGGGGWGDPSTDIAFNTLAASITPQHYTTRMSGAIGGLTAGRNWRANPFSVVGLEGDISASGIKGSSTNAAFCAGTACTYSETEKLNWLATVRARAGITPWNPLLIYVTGGLAVGGVKAANQILDGASMWSGSDSSTRTGWVAGAGAEYALTPQTSLKVEYLHYDLGTFSVVSPSPTAAAILNANVKTAGEIVRAGFNWHF